MSIQGLVGLPGHGKSYSALELFIIQALEEKRTIVTNIPLKPLAFERYPDADVRPIDLTELAKKENNHLWLEQPKSALFLLDELWRIWPSGLKATGIPKEQLSFIKEHRHNIDETGREPDIILVTQDLNDIASAIRSMVETTIICTKLTAIGAKGHFRRDYYQGSVKGFIGPKNVFIRSDQCKYKPEIFDLYKSHTLSTGNAQTIDNKGVVNATIFNGLGFKFGIGFLAFLIVGVVWGFNKTSADIDKMTAKKTPEIATTQHTAQPAIYAITQPTKPPLSIYSQTWRLVGVFTIASGRMIALIENGQDSVRIDYSKCLNDLEITCEYDGEKITRFSGQHKTEKVSEKVISKI
jgi:zona occludens toxin